MDLNLVNGQIFVLSKMAVKTQSTADLNPHLRTDP